MNPLDRGYLRVAVETGVPWPPTDLTLQFGGHSLTLSPETDKHPPSIVLRYDERLKQAGALRLISEFATALAWAESRPVNLTLVAACTAPGLRLGRSPLRGPVGAFSFDYLPQPDDRKAKLALALFREGLTVNLAPYQFLAFYRVINLHVGPSGPTQIDWMNRELTDEGSLDGDAVARLRILRPEQSDVGKYLYVQCRSAAAHASLEQVTIHPDDPEDSVRLSKDLPIVQALAARIIERDLAVPSRRAFRAKGS